MAGTQNGGEHYAAAMRVMRAHDNPHLQLTTEQSTESATWVIAHALMGLLADRLRDDPETPAS